jgi:rhodanese-related sulfurtransferase
MSTQVPAIHTMKDLHDHMGKFGKNTLILDVREPDEFSEGHVPGARNIPVGQVGNHTQELAHFERIYVHCRSGKRSQMATAELERRGLKNLVCISLGGMLDWMQAGYPVER